MSKRIKVSAILPPLGIYQRKPIEAEGYAPSATSRFAVVRPKDARAWRLIHLRSGGGLDSLLPAMGRTYTLRDKLAVARDWDLSSIDFSPFDALPAATLDMTEAPAFVPTPGLGDMLQAMRELAAIALERASLES